MKHRNANTTLSDMQNCWEHLKYIKEINDYANHGNKNKGK